MLRLRLGGHHLLPKVPSNYDMPRRPIFFEWVHLVIEHPGMLFGHEGIGTRTGLAMLVAMRKQTELWRQEDEAYTDKVANEVAAQEEMG